MPFTARLQRARFDVQPDIYDATIISIDEVASQFRRPDGTQMSDVRWEFSLHGLDAHARGWTPPFFTRRDDCKLFKWVCVALGVDDLPEDYEFDADDVIGIKVKVFVQRSPGGHAKVADVLPLDYTEDWT